MKISIKTSDKKNKYMTHIVVNGIDIGMYASGYQLKQEPGEIPVLRKPGTAQYAGMISGKRAQDYRILPHRQPACKFLPDRLQ